MTRHARLTALLARNWELIVHGIQVLAWLGLLPIFFWLVADPELEPAFIFVASIVLGFAVHFICKELIGAIRDGEGKVARSILIAMIVGEFTLYGWFVYHMLFQF